MKRFILVIALFSFISFGCSENDSIVNQPYNADQISLDKKIADDLTFTQLINGDKGGKIVIKSNAIKLRLTVPRGAYSGDKLITVTLDPESSTIAFGPDTPEFEKALILDVKMANIWYNGESLKFAYFADSGDVEEVASNSVGYEQNKNWVFVKGAQLEHFSRYGFTK